MNVSLGQLLKTARQEKGLTTIEVAEKTRFNLRFIRAAEEDRFSELPSAVFAVGFLRSYSALLELDGDSLVKRYATLGIVDEDRSPNLISMPLYKDPGESIRIVFIVLSVFIVTLSAIVYYHFGNLDVFTPQEKATTKPGDIPGDQKVKAPTMAESSPEKIEEDFQEEESVTNDQMPGAGERTENVDFNPESEQAPIAGDEPENLAESERAPPGEETQDVKTPMRLKIVADSDTWIKVAIDDEEAREIILREGNDVIWEAASGYVLSIGNAAGARIFLDEKEIAIKKPPSNVIIDMKLPANQE